jgi:hypothetical protein
MDRARAADDATAPDLVDDRPWVVYNRAVLSFSPADLGDLTPNHRRLCEQMAGVTVERADRLVVAIGLRLGRRIALRWTDGRLNGLAFSTRHGTWGSWTNIADCAPRFARALLLDEDVVLRGQLLADMAKLDRLNDEAR